MICEFWGQDLAKHRPAKIANKVEQHSDPFPKKRAGPRKSHEVSATADIATASIHRAVQMLAIQASKMYSLRGLQQHVSKSAASHHGGTKTRKPTTVMMRNIPATFTREMALNVLDGEGFFGKCNFYYQPIDFLSGVGYSTPSSILSIKTQHSSTRKSLEDSRIGDF